MTEGNKFRLKKAGHDFMDITDHPDLGQHNSQRQRVKADLPSVGLSEQAKSSIKAMLIDLDDKHLRADIAKLSSFWNRNYRSTWGLLSSNWIYDQVQAVSKYNLRTFISRHNHALQIFSTSDHEMINTSVSKFHHEFLQNSIIARIEAVDQSVSDKDKELIILSAHQVNFPLVHPEFHDAYIYAIRTPSTTCSHSTAHQVQMTMDQDP
jgi:leucyl aminopeptidase